MLYIGDQTATRIAERVFQVTSPVVTEIHPQSGVSVGVAAAANGAAPGELLRLADEALYPAKALLGQVGR